MSWPVQDGSFARGDLPMERGGTISDAHLVWQSHGTLSARRDNVIVYPTSYTAQHDDLSWLRRSTAFDGRDPGLPDMLTDIALNLQAQMLNRADNSPTTGASRLPDGADARDTACR